MKENLCMVDFAIADPRSIPAMIRGTGNGCEKVWLRFEHRFPEIPDQEILMEFFSREARYARADIDFKKMARRQKYWWYVVVTLFILA